jgi:hypothetical protein
VILFECQILRNNKQNGGSRGERERRMKSLWGVSMGSLNGEFGKEKRKMKKVQAMDGGDS